MKKLMSLSLFCMMAFVSLFSSTSVEAVYKPKEFYVLGIPKAGTSLASKLLMLITEREAINPVKDGLELNELERSALEIHFTKWKKANQFPVAHFSKGARAFDDYSEVNPDIVRFLVIRDLRDALVSCVYQNWAELESMMEGTNFSQKLWFLLNARGNPFDMMPDVEEAIARLKKNNVIVLRFEDLVGEQGGSTREIQQKTVLNVVNALGTHLKKGQFHRVVSSLWGNESELKSPTFREGKIGSWKNHFEKHHLEAFERNWGGLQKALGYPVK